MGNEFDKTNRRIQERQEAARQQELFREQEQKILQRIEILKKQQAEQKRQQSIQEKGERKIILPQVQKTALEFLRDINKEIFKGRGKLEEWKKIENIHTHTEHYQEGLGDNYRSWSETKTHNSKQLVTKLELSNNQAIIFSIPLQLLLQTTKEKFREERDMLFRKTGNLYSAGYEYGWDEILEDDEQMGHIALGGEKCIKEPSRVPHNYYENMKEMVHLYGPNFNPPIKCKIPLEDSEWRKFKELVLFYVGEKYEGFN